MVVTVTGHRGRNLKLSGCCDLTPKTEQYGLGRNHPLSSGLAWQCNFSSYPDIVKKENYQLGCD